ncbi:MAG: MarR family winged helix-turn-helix transcriptional regulator [Cytophagales bacterium]
MRSIVPLILKWEEFCDRLDAKISQDSALSLFAIWLLTGKQAKSFSSLDDENMKNYFKSVNPEFLSNFCGYLIARLYKFSRLYTKDILTKHQLNSIDEFGILAHLQKESQANIKSISERLMNEYSTTVEMINRLTKQGLTEGFSDENDKRSKLIRLTEKGRHLVFSLFQDFNHSQDLLIGLDEWEKLILLKILEKLDNEHNQLIFESK